MKNEKHTFTSSCDTSLFEFLRANLTSKSRNNIKTLMKNGFCAVDGKIQTQFDAPVKKGQTVTVSGENAMRHSLPFRILYEDEKIVVIDKPAGLLSVANEKEKERTAYRILSDYVKSADRRAKIFIVHRLDRDTSGILLFAKDAGTKAAFQENWDSLVIRRGYTAVCEGTPAAESGVLTSYLRESTGHMVYSTDSKKHSQKAITKYSVIKSNGSFSLLDIEIETGRKNQIRVQLSEFGHPVAGDKKYGAETNPLKRLALHASVLELKTPYGKSLKFISKAPESFRAICR